MDSVDDITVDQIMERYDERRSLYEDFKNRQVTLLTEFLKENGPHVFSISGRVKERESLRRKLSRPGSKYTRLEEVQDLVGIRIVTFFEEEVDQVAEVIRKEFKINEAHILDRGEALDPERWGYRSRYYNVGLLDNRLKLIEYKRFVGCAAEIQVRSLLQHAWAEIETQMGYTSRDTFPKERRRQFSRIAGMLELADQEFNETNRFLKPYRQRMVEQVASGHDNPLPADMQRDPIGNDSLTQFIQENALVREMDARLAQLINVSLEDNGDFIDEVATHLSYLNLGTITALENELRMQRKTILGIAKQIFDRQGNKEFSALWRGISIYMLSYTLSAVAEKSEPLLHGLDRTEIGPLMARSPFDDDSELAPW
ncbi:GTP pyrophosphokinase [Magnetococcus sp. PR-3]|uniref:GTP pyrophosphokinase n=1 Tax=Magnetococcus sp. PR-3 TaxID=3120355 RepID=UPI002FCDF98A